MRILQVLSLAFLTTLGGCASVSHLTLAPDSGTHRFVQSFDHAYASRDEAGDYRFVLVDDGLDDVARAGPLHPAPNPPVRQVVRIRMFWRPMQGTKPNFPSASNAAIDWYVLGTGSRESIDMVHYQGVGFVSVRPAAGGATVTIHKASLQPVVCTGHMGDPIGPTVLSGTVFALTDEGQVQRTWDQTRHAAELAMNRAGTAMDASASSR